MKRGPLQARYLGAATRSERSVTVVTPEGTPLSFGIARAGDRLAALLFDGAVMLAIILLSLLLAVVLMSAIRGSTDFLWAFFVVTLFLTRAFYFTWFELGRNGATPGKRRMQLRVVDAGGGQLRSEAVLVRGFMRELELWLPIQYILTADAQLGLGRGWVLLGASIWALGLVSFPLFNAERRRVGDYVAGTIVVVLPKAALRSDLGRRSKEENKAESAADSATYTFGREMLEFYGIYELEVLEDMLRKRGRGRREAMATIAEKIKAKIGWPDGPPVVPEAFLRDFYRAQRSHLERKMLLGKRKERKDGSSREDRPSV